MKSLSAATNHVVGLSLFKVIFGITLLFIASQVQISLNPVPITLQSVGVLIIALSYSKKEAMSSIISFVALGAIGAPVFSGYRSGMGVLMGPSGGYIFGMILCVYVVTALREKYGEDSWVKLIIYSIIGSSCLYLVGLMQLSLFVSAHKVFELGLYPFIIPGIIKALFTGSSVRLLQKNSK